MEELKQQAPISVPPTKPASTPVDSLMDKIKQSMPSTSSVPQEMKPRMPQQPQQSTYIEQAKSGFQNVLLVVLVVSVIAIILAYFYPKQDESDATSKYILLGGVLGVLVSGGLLWFM